VHLRESAVFADEQGSRYRTAAQCFPIFPFVRFVTFVVAFSDSSDKDWII
jgi:hypothetical protein